ncbi:MAG: protein kinase [Planctomycetes bacterium]|nr:protein kinase [Planctomycetota bacterium]
MSTDPLEDALASWFDAAVGGAPPDPEEFARARGVDPPRFAARLADARWLVARHEAARGQTQALALPCRLGEYELLAEAGRGGMGVVYRARQPGLDRQVAVKVLDPSRAADHRARTRFLAEARAAARVRHANVVAVLSVGEDRGHAFYAMEWIDGEDLAEILRHASGPGGPERHRGSAALLAKVARALQEVHECGLLHRDVKPANIMVDAAGEPHLADFGLVKDLSADTLTLSGDVIGSPAYMSPEQLVDARHATVRSDVYSLGVTLYECLTLRRPYPATTTTALREALAAAAHPRPRSIDPAIPPGLEWICLRAMAPEPRLRYPSAAALAADLEAFLRGEPVTAEPPSLRLRGARLLRRHGRRLAVAAVAIALAGTFWSLWAGIRAEAAARTRAGLWHQLADARLWDDTVQLALRLADLARHDPQDPAVHVLRTLAAVRRRDTTALRGALADLRQRARGDAPLAELAAGIEAALRRVRQEPARVDDPAALARLGADTEPDPVRLWLRGEVLGLLQRWDECADRLRAARAADPALVTRVAPTLVRSLQRRGQIGAARDELIGYARAVQQPRAFAQVVQLALLAGDPAQARRDADELRRLFPASGWNEFAELLLLPANQESASELDARLARALGHADERAALARPFQSLLADLHRQRGNPQRAVELWTEMLRDDPADPNVRGLLGTALLQLGDQQGDAALRERGLEELHRAAKDADDLLFERDMHWGTWHYCAQRFAEAVVHFREAVRLVPDHPRCWRSLAGACRAAAALAPDPAASLAYLREGVAAQQREVDMARGDVRAWELLIGQLSALREHLPQGDAPEHDLVSDRLQHARVEVKRLRQMSVRPR